MGSLASANYTFALVGGIATVTNEDALIDMPGADVLHCAQPDCGVDGCADQSLFLREAQDGNLGNKLVGRTVTVSAAPTGGGWTTTCTATVTSASGGVGSLGCTLSGLNVNDAYDVQLTLSGNQYYTAPIEDVVITTSTSGTGFMTGGGWITEPNLGARSNFGFNAKSKGKTLSGSSLYIFRKTLTAPETVNGITLPVGDYNWIIKSNAVTGLTMSCSSTTGYCTRASSRVSPR